MISRFDVIPKRRTLVVELLSLIIASVLGVYMLVQRDAGAQPATRADAATMVGDAKDAAPVDASPVAVIPSDAGGSDTAPQPIDLAIAPDGGVPFHPGEHAYRSPMARPDRGSAARAKVALKLNSIDDYDVKTGLFSADFFISFTSDTPMPPLSLVFPNGQLDSKEVIIDKPTLKLFRMTGKFKAPSDLRKYPFDAQKLTILIEDDQNGIDRIRFHADHERTDLSRGFRILGWGVQYVEARSFSHAYDRFEGDDLYFNRYVFELGVERFATSAAFKVFVPALVIVIIALLGMWVPPSAMEVRFSAGAPMLAGAVLFHFALMQELPATSYLTRADKLMLGVYASLLLCTLSTWLMFLVREEKVTAVFRAARVVVPLTSAAIMYLAITL